eukprot:EG_transcript_19737
MNKAMRLRDMPKVEYWRPLIWDIDMALRALPSYEGKSYRGIKCQVSPAEFVVGGTICWTAFSSASQRKAVAEEFAKPPAEGRGVGTLFFVTSFGAKPISAISRYPDEAEVLFPPNTLFQVTSTLFGDSEIGEFYKVVDNVAMTQVAGGQPQLTSAKPLAARLQRLPHHKPIVLHVPAILIDFLLDPVGLTTGMQLKLLSSAIPADEAAEDGPVGELQLLKCLPSLPDPVVTSPRSSASTFDLI